jgi:phosphoribosylformylglycinamidine synthase
MLTLPGPVAYSSFRINALINNINTSVNSSAVVGIRTIYVHYVSIKSEVKNLDDREQKLLSSLLDYESQPDLSDELTSILVNSINKETLVPDDTYLLQVIPRPGTISPWSSKATNIAQNCGVTGVDRIERGLALIIKARKGFPLDEHLSSGVFLDFIYDRMTQVRFMQCLAFEFTLTVLVGHFV